MKKRFSLVVAILMFGNLSACNTVSGVGKDLQKAGSALEKAAEKKKDEEND